MLLLWNVATQALRDVFVTTWDQAYPALLWGNDPASWQRFVHGHFDPVSTLPGTVVVLAKDISEKGKENDTTGTPRLFGKATFTNEWTGLKKGERIRISGTHATFDVVLTNSPSSIVFLQSTVCAPASE